MFAFARLSKTQKFKIRFWLFRLGLLVPFEVLQNLSRYWQKKPHEFGFQYFSQLKNAQGLFLDVGANSAQSALSFRLYCKTYHTLSLEPNPHLRAHWRWILPFLGRRSSFRNIGLAPVNEQREFFIPLYHHFPFHQEASLHVEMLKDPDTIHRLQDFTGENDFTIKKMKLNFTSFASLGVQPDIIKIDVQGAEVEILRSMEEHLKTRKPLLLVECESEHKNEIVEYLRALGYTQKYYHTESQSLFTADQGHGITFFENGEFRG